MRVSTAFLRPRRACRGCGSARSALQADRVVGTLALPGSPALAAKSARTRRATGRAGRITILVWRHLDLGRWRLEVHARLRRPRCPEHGAHVEGVPFAPATARGFMRDFENLIAWLATKTDKTATCRLTRDRLEDELTHYSAGRAGADRQRPGHKKWGDLDRRGRVAQGPPLPDDHRRSPAPLRGVGLRGQGQGRLLMSSLR